jgi:hypothetical protein
MSEERVFWASEATASDDREQLELEGKKSVHRLAILKIYRQCRFYGIAVLHVLVCLCYVSVFGPCPSPCSCQCPSICVYVGVCASVGVCVGVHIFLFSILKCQHTGRTLIFRFKFASSAEESSCFSQF